ncbi:MAG: ABC transporter permease [Steroidobacteraceae bacterium]
MAFFKQTLALTATGLAGIPRRLDSSFVTVIGVTTAVGVLVSLLAIGEGAEIFTGQKSAQDLAVVLNRGATSALQSVLTRQDLAVIEAAPGVKRSPDGKPWVVATTVVSVDAIKKDGTRANTFLVGFSPGVNVAQSYIRYVAGRQYRPGVHEIAVPEPITKQYRDMNIGDRINLRGSEWKIVGVFAGNDTIGDSAMRADADTVMSAFGINTYQIATVTLTSPAAYPTFKNWLLKNPAIAVDVKTGPQYNKDEFGQLTALVDFVAYFIGVVMGSGAVFGALNSLYASVDARRREIGTLRAIGFRNAPIICSVLLEGMALALPGALIGALIAWLAFNGNGVDVQGLVFKLTVTPRLILDGITWALAIGLIGGSLPALRAARMPVVAALRAS